MTGPSPTRDIRFHDVTRLTVLIGVQPIRIQALSRSAVPEKHRLIQSIFYRVGKNNDVPGDIVFGSEHLRHAKTRSWAERRHGRRAQKHAASNEKIERKETFSIRTWGIIKDDSSTAFP